MRFAEQCSGVLSPLGQRGRSISRYISQRVESGSRALVYTSDSQSLGRARKSTAKRLLLLPAFGAYSDSLAGRAVC